MEKLISGTSQNAVTPNSTSSFGLLQAIIRPSVIKNSQKNTLTAIGLS
jgi:predicted solute-binding protein